VIERQIGDDGIATVVMDDGKVNALDLDFFSRLDAALDDCADDAAVVLTGRPGMFSAGLNTKTMAALDTEGLTEMLVQFARTFLRVWLEPRPVVAAVTGHAIAGGTILAMTCDHAVAADGEFGWGLTETTIGFPLPQWIIGVARNNVGAQHLDDLLLPGRTVGPAEAVEVGFADELRPPEQVMVAAQERALALTKLPRSTYAETKRRLRGPTVAEVLDSLESDTRASLAARPA
jgi:enoyl-CoA hydratase